MPLKTFIMLIINALLAQCAVATEVLIPSKDILETQYGSRLRTESWSERRDASSAISAYREEVEKLKDLFATCEVGWRKRPDVCEGQPFIGDKKVGDEGFVENASNARFMYIFDVTLCLKKIKDNLELLTQKIDGENYDAALHYQEKIKMQTIRNILYSKVNGANGMRAHGMSFSVVTKQEWNGKSALTRFEEIVGNPLISAKGSLQKALEALLLTIDTKDHQ